MTPMKTRAARSHDLVSLAGGKVVGGFPDQRRRHTRPLSEPLKPLKVGLRAQDVQTSVQDVELGPLNAETKNIRLVGMAERLAIHIRGADIIRDYRRLEYIASQFGIDSLGVLPKVLDVLQELSWVRVDNSGPEPKVEETVPYFTDIYTAAGSYFQASKPSEIETAALAVCDALASSPTTKEQLLGALGIDEKAYRTIVDIGKSGRFLEEYQSPAAKAPVLYSPLFWVENPTKLDDLAELLQAYGAEDVCRALARVRSYPGLPLRDAVLAPDQELRREDEIARELIRRGILLAPDVTSHSGRKNFAFTPHVGIPVERKMVLEKAMAILACIRYGEHFGAITRIKFPTDIIDRLISPPHRIGSHTEIRRQYALLVGRGMGRSFPDRHNPGRFYFELVPKPENIQACRLARDLLAAGDVLEGKGLSLDLQRLLLHPGGSYEEAMRTLPKLRQSVTISAETQRRLASVLDDTMDKLRGA